MVIKAFCSLASRQSVSTHALEWRLQVMKSPAKLRAAVQWIQQHLIFGIDQRVHVFEVTIRALGKQLCTCQAVLHLDLLPVLGV